jgi:hypothetical protein
VQGEQREEHAEYVLPLGDPRDRFHVQRMHREQRGYDRAGPVAARHSPQQQKQQHDVRRMKRHVHEMVPAGRQAEQRDVEHV